MHCWPGDVERDFWLSLDLLKSPKDHAEFVVVRDWIRDALAPCVRDVEIEVPKSVLKQVRIALIQFAGGVCCRRAVELMPVSVDVGAQGGVMWCGCCGVDVEVWMTWCG